MLKPFLTANWRYLAMLNFEVDPKILAPHVPVGTQLDFHNDKTYVSVVGFLFYHTIVCGLPIPRHRNFEEVNLRFYVRKKSADTWRRGVVFIREHYWGYTARGERTSEYRVEHSRWKIW